MWLHVCSWSTSKRPYFERLKLITALAADSKTVNDKVDECVDDYPIQGRPSTAEFLGFSPVSLQAPICMLSLQGSLLVLYVETLTAVQGLLLPWGVGVGQQDSDYVVVSDLCRSCCRTLAPEAKTFKHVIAFQINAYGLGANLAGLARHSSVQQRERRPGLMGQLSNVEGDFYRGRMHIGWIAYEVRCYEEGCTDAFAGDEQG
eukprot:1161887-Pelagomonas_calceolata.AAC.2